MESILTSIKKLLGIEEDYEHFDPDIIMHINTVLGDLTQLGVGPSEGFSIEDETSTWIDFISSDSPVKLEGVKSYIHLRVKLLFDPPSSASVLASYERQIEKMEWRLNVAAETTGVDSGTNNGGTNNNTNSGTTNTETSKDTVTLKDQVTGASYELYVRNAKLGMSEKEV